MDDLKKAIQALCMFFAGLILLIPHRIGMSRVNYIIKRYNLPISRAGLLLYKYHNNIELSLTIGTLFGNIIVWSLYKKAADPMISGAKQKEEWKFGIRGSIIGFLFLMLMSSIIMYIIYISGGDFGHLNAFYFSLIFLTLCDGFANAFAFAINGRYSSLLSAGIPLSGLLVTLLHYTYKLFSDDKDNLWDDFDYHVLRVQLLWNILFIFIALILWSVDQGIDIITISCHDNGRTECTDTSIDELSKLCDTYNKVKHFSGKCPHKLGENHDILHLFNTSIHGADNEDHRRDWVPIGMLAISLGTVYAFYPSIAPYSIIDFQYASVIELWILIISALLPLLFAILDMDFAGNRGPSGKVNVVTVTSRLEFSGSSIQVKHGAAVTSHADIPDCHNSNNSAHNWSSTNYTYSIKDGDKFKDNGSIKTFVVNYDPSQKNKKPTKITYKYYYNWFQYKAIDADDGDITSSNSKCWWSLVWLCAIPYILCIQIFMSLLHYPDCLLSCFFKSKPFRIQFISILFNTLRELMQACGFAGAGKQSYDKISSTNGNVFESVSITTITTSNEPSATNQAKITLETGVTLNSDSESATATLKIPKDASDYVSDTPFNGSIAACNKLITLFAMTFCVFTGDGYLQHYRRCCRDCWPTTGYTKYQSFFYWLHFGFKGGIKSITSSFTDLYYHNLRPQFISYA